MQSHHAIVNTGLYSKINTKIITIHGLNLGYLGRNKTDERVWKDQRMGGDKQGRWCKDEVKWVHQTRLRLETININKAWRSSVRKIKKIIQLSGENFFLPVCWW